MLEKQMIDVAVNGQLNTKTDERLTDESNFLKQENVRFVKTGALTKRFGFDILDDVTTEESIDIISDSRALLALSAPNKRTFLKFNENDNEFKPYPDMKSTSPFQLELETEISSEYGMYAADMDYIDGVYCVIGQHQSPNDNASIYYMDADSGETIVFYDVFNLNNIKVRAIEISGAAYFFIVGQVDGTSNFSWQLRDKFGVLITSATVASSVVADSNLDLIGNIAGNGFLVALQTSAGNDFICYDFDFALTTPVLTNFTINPTVGPTAPSCFSLIKDSSKYYVVYFGSTGNRARFTSFNAAGSIIDDTVDFSLTFVTSTPNIERISAAVSGDFIYAYVNAGPTADGLQQVQLSKYQFSTASLSITNLIPPCLILTQMFLDQDQWCIVGSTRNGDAESCWILGQERQVLGQFHHLTAWQRDTNHNQLTKIVERGSDLYFVANKAIAYEGEGGELREKYGISLIKINRTNYKQKYISSKIGDSLVRSGAFLHEYDNFTFTENGFISKPTIVNTTNNVGLGSIAAGTYRYVAMYEFTDKSGRVHRSAPSLPRTVTIPGANYSVTLAVTTSPSNKNDRGYTVVFYRTLAGGSTYYRVSPLNRPASLIQGPSLFATYDDALADASIADNELLYTTGGVLDNDPCPPCTFVCNHNNRLWVVHALEKDQVNYSKVISQGEGVAFSDFFFFNVLSQQNKRRDEITALASLRDKLVIFKRNSIHYVSGDGANDTGAASTLTNPEMVYFDIGCTEPKSVINIPQGTMFKSEKGIYLLDAGLGLNYIGAAVEAYNSSEILSAEINEEENIVLFQTATEILIFDYQQNRWSVDTIAVDKMTVWNKKNVYLLTEDNKTKVFLETTDYQDCDIDEARQNVSMRMQTGWMKLSVLQGFSRIYRCYILGKYLSAHTLKLRAYYDYDDSTFDEYDLTHDPSNTVYQFGVHLKRQKCESIKIEVYDVGTGASVQLSGITFEVGIKRGLAKLPAAKRY
jgi:hypothetical protein